MTGCGAAQGPACALAIWSKDCRHVVVGNSWGAVMILNQKGAVVSAVTLAGNPSVKNLALSPAGDCLLVNASDRVIRVMGLPDLVTRRELYDVVNKLQWKQARFSGDGEYILGGSAERAEHKVFIWRASSGELVNVLEGPKEGIMDVHWHPSRAEVATAARDGSVFLWAKHATETWSSFAPDFKELEENEVYHELENEFDIIPEKELQEDRDKEEEVVVDVETWEDEEASDPEDTLRTLPAILDTAPEDYTGTELDVENMRINMRFKAQRAAAATAKQGAPFDSITKAALAAARTVEAAYEAKHPGYTRASLESLRNPPVGPS